MVTVHVSYWARLPAHCLSSFLLEVHFRNTTTDDQNWSLQPWCRQIWLIWVVRLATPHQVLGPLELCRVLGCKWSPYRIRPSQTVSNNLRHDCEKIFGHRSCHADNASIPAINQCKESPRHLLTYNQNLQNGLSLFYFSVFSYLKIMARDSTPVNL